ncbi:alpha-2-macroglobulin-like isoform X2 [Agrilus planipennis]|uniref:Alpha-2-macroglobulin-like isoform X2 n=1 Tax=Agrilus planipennis TaxID=224129 RepID=A0A7F5R596_AGRPL|nr:alpha-2-macroglobulin-like isoform X2 [Agrilus planipennis]
MSKSHIVNEAYKMKFSDDILFFHPGFSYKGRLSATNVLIDLRGEVVEICYTVAVNYVWNIQNIKECSNFTFDDDNGIDFSLPPLKDNVIKVDLQAVSLNQTIKEEWPTRIGQSFPDRYNTKVTASASISRWYSPSRSYIHLEPMQKTHLQCQSVQEYIVQYSSNLIDSGETVYFHYIIKSRSKIFQSGRLIHRSTKHHPILITELNNAVGSNHSFVKNNNFVDKFSFKLSLGNEVYSKARLLLYFVLKTAETVASSVDVNIEKCLPNEVNAKWSEKGFRPGDEAKLTIKTSADSICAVSAMDKSSIALSNSKPLTVASILKPFIEEKETKQTSILNCVPRHVRKPLGIEKTNNNSNPIARRRRSPSRTYFSSQYDSFEAFDVIGVGFITNLNILTKQCEEGNKLVNHNPPSPLNSTHSKEMRGYHYNVDDSDEEIVKRSLFPETWLWDLVPLDGNEQLQIARPLPHSITNWITNVLCVSPTKGVGVSPNLEISVFQPFFLDVLAPRTIKRNEIVHLQTIIFNYLNYSIPLRISLGNTSNVDSIGYPDDRAVTHCVHPNDSKVVIFRIKSPYLGQINISILAEVDSSYPGECGPDIIINKRDEVVKSIIVEPEGHTVEKTGSILLCGGDNVLPNNVSWTLSVPNDIIRDSDKAIVTIDADLMGPTIRNIEKLINVPSGCGEQLVAAIAPNLYILRYLNATGKLLGPTRQRIIRNLKIGYQRILNYVHTDGSFSAFGYHDAVGSTFLTSFVVRTLVQLKQHIYVDQSIIDKAVEWILMNQLENGCFNAVSHVFHDMGGTSNENSTAALTSYVIISILESGIELKEKVRNDAQFCIRGHHSPDKYTLAISSYALSLIGWQSEATRALRRLLEIAIVEDNLMWWSSPESISTNIEMTGYALMTLLHHGGTENLIHAHSVVRWLITQRQSHGGFTTSQDTAVALDAISRYMVLVKGKSANLSVHVATNEREHTMPITHRDKLKTKQISVSRLPNVIKVIVNGQGCVLATNVVYYNLEHMMNSEAFKLAVDVESVSSTDKCSIAMVSPCLAYKMPDIKSNMAVLEIKMPTGYEPDRGSLYKLQESNSKVKRFEESENQVVLYFTQLSHDPICVPFTINENAVVDSRVDAIAKLYDYYKPELQIAIVRTFFFY